MNSHKEILENMKETSTVDNISAFTANKSKKLIKKKSNTHQTLRHHSGLKITVIKKKSGRKEKVQKQQNQLPFYLEVMYFFIFCIC